MIAAELNHEPTDRATVGRSAGKLAEDLAVLAELHWQLFLSDAKQYISEIVALAVMAAAAAVLLLAAVFFGLAAITQRLMSAGMSPAESCGLVALGTIVAAAALLISIWTRTRTSQLSGAFARSRTEAARNVAWIKDVIAARKGDPNNS